MHPSGCFSLFKYRTMNFEDACELMMLYAISPELTCTCDQYHTCQQCDEEDRKRHKQDEENKTK